MAKDNEKRVSEDMNEEELENIAGGWCMSSGISTPVKGIKRVFRSDMVAKGYDGYGIRIDYDDGSSIVSIFDKKGNLQKTLDPNKDTFEF